MRQEERRLRPTLNDIAQAAQVSLATVDRVMNRRSGVSARTSMQVMAAARALGYLPEGNTASSAKVLFLLPQGTNAYIAELARQAQNHAKTVPFFDVEVVRIRALDPHALAEAISQAGASSHGIAVVALNHPAVREAIRGVVNDGGPVVTLASDSPDAPRRAFIGIDNGQAGRLAGYTVGRFLGQKPKGKVALFAGTIAYRGHQEREMGFRQVLAEDYPGLEVLELRESREDRKKAFKLTGDLLKAHGDLVGLYNAGGATVGIAAALEGAKRKSLVFVAHEATEENKAYLLSGTLDAVIDQNARAQITETFKTLGAALEGKDHQPEPVQLQLIVRENLPPL